MRRLALIILLHVAAGSPLIAQATAPGPTPSHSRAAEELLLLLGMDKPAVNAAPMFESMKQLSPTPHALEVAKEFMEKYLKWEELKPELIAAYTDTFSERELRDLLKFYKTPIGTKFRTAMPTLLAKTMTIFQNRLQPHMMEMVDAIMKRVPPR